MANKAESVTLAELQAWVKNNEHRTWHWPRLDSDKMLTLEIKYLNFSLDTRDMSVWRIWIEGSNRDIEVRDGEEFEGNILGLLEQRLNSAMGVNKK